MSAIFAARGEPATAGDARDANGDGLVTVNDGRLCALECDLPDCREVPVCGLLGTEPALLLLGVIGWRRRHLSEVALLPARADAAR